MSTRTPTLVLAALLALGFPACQGDEADRSGDAAARRSGATSDPGSRYLDAAGPIGGLTQETPPAVGRPRPAPRGAP